MNFIIGNEPIRWRLPVRGCPVQVTYDTEDRITYIDLKRTSGNQYQNILSRHILAEVIAAIKAGYPTVIVDYGITQGKLAKELMSEDSQRLIWERAGINSDKFKIVRVDLEKPEGIDTAIIFDRVEQKSNDFSLPSRITSLSNGPANSNELYVSNSGTIPGANNFNVIGTFDVPFQSTQADSHEFDAMIKSLQDPKKAPEDAGKSLFDARAQVFQEYPWPNSSSPLTISSSTMDFNFSTDEILLEGYGPWSDELEKAMSLIEQGNQVILKKEDPNGIERPVTIKLQQGENNKELIVDLTNLGIIECSDVLPKLLNYLLNQDGKSIILNCGLIGPDDLVEAVEEYILSDLPCSTAYELIYREIPKGYMHPVLMFK